jgi:hypothetical protein
MKKKDPKVVENRLRDTLRRRGYRLEKSRRRDPHALTYGRYWIIGERIQIDRGEGVEDFAVDKKKLHPISFCVLVTKGSKRDRAHDFTMTLDEVDALCSPESNAFAPISEGIFQAAKMDCVLAWEFYTSDSWEDATVALAPKSSERPRRK